MRAVGCGREGLSSRAVGHDNVQSGARARYSSAVVGGAKAMVSGGRGD